MALIRAAITYNRLPDFIGSALILGKHSKCAHGTARAAGRPCRSEVCHQSSRARLSACSSPRTFQRPSWSFGEEQRSAQLPSRVEPNASVRGRRHINAVGNILGDGSDEDNVESHAVFWPNSVSAPVALASPGGEFITQMSP